MGGEELMRTQFNINRVPYQEKVVDLLAYPAHFVLPCHFDASKTSKYRPELYNVSK
jgi:hypothetical protein